MRYIFTRLPVKSLVQCKYVCSSWRRCILNPNFTKLLFPGTRLLIRSGGFINESTNPDTTDRRRHHKISEITVLIGLDKKDYSKPNVDVALKLPKDPNLPPVGLRTVGSWNGLLCLVDIFSQYYISNPTTGESFALPSILSTKDKDKRIHRFSWFGFCPVSRVFKVLSTLSMLRYGDEEEAMVLTVGSPSWRSIRVCSTMERYISSATGRNIYLNGLLYWISSWSIRTISLCSFDVEREVFQMLPSFTVAVGGADGSYLSDCELGVLRGCLGLFVKFRMSSGAGYGDDIIRIWVMKNSAVKESWTKEYETRNSVLPNVYGVLEISEEGQILKVENGKLHVYNRDRGLVRVEDDGIPSNITNACVHILSFLSPSDRYDHGYLIKSTPS